MAKQITIGIIDDHSLFRTALISHINTINNSTRGFTFNVSLDASNGKEFINKLKPSFPPDITLLDINMPIMNGIETMDWINKHLNTKVIVLSMFSDESIIIAMLQKGARGYITKDSDTKFFVNALESVYSGGLYFSDSIEKSLFKMLSRGTVSVQTPHPLSGREIEFLKLVCTELTYKEIAEKMNLSARTIDYYKDDLMRKLNINGRVGLIMYAINHGIYKL